MVLLETKYLPIEELADVRGGIQKGPHRAPGKNPVRYLTVAHVQRNRISFDDPRYFEVSPEELDRWRLKKGDVLIIEGNGSAEQIGRTALFRGEIDECVHQNHVIRIRPNSDIVAPEFLNAYLNSPPGKDEVRARSNSTSGLRTLSVGQIKRISVPVLPLPEQRRIVARIEELAQRIEQARGLRREAVEDVESALKASVDRWFPDTSVESWPTLTQVVAYIENGWSPSCLPEVAAPGDWGVLKVGAVSTGRFVPIENKKLPPELMPRPELEIRHGDFLMGRANTTELTGACAIAVDPPPRLLLCDKIFRFQFKPEAQIDIGYLNYALKSQPLRRQIEAVATGTSSSMKNISKDKVMQLRLPLPPLSEQQRIVAYLDALQAKAEAVKRLQAASAAELEALLPAVLEQAFRGEL